MSFHELKLDASPNLQTTKFVPFFDVLFEKDTTKANPTPSQLGKGAPHRISKGGLSTVFLSFGGKANPTPSQLGKGVRIGAQK